MRIATPITLKRDEKFTLEDVTCVIPTWMKPELAFRATRRLKHFYPDLPIIIVDDGSPQKDFDRLRQCPAELYRHEKNRNHGAALDTGLEHVKTTLMLSCDYDIILVREGAIEFLLDMMENNVIAAGWMKKNKASNVTGFQFIHPAFALWRKDIIDYEHLSFMMVVFKVGQFITQTGQMLTAVAQTRKSPSGARYLIKGFPASRFKKYYIHRQWRRESRGKHLWLKKMYGQKA